MYFIPVRSPGERTPIPFRESGTEEGASGKMMTWLKEFSLPGREWEERFIWDHFGAADLTCYQSVYPFHTLNGKIVRLDFAPITIFYGGNGSGKTTVLNLIAEKFHAKRLSPFNQSPFFGDYLAGCGGVLEGNPYETLFVASDDVFLSMLNSRFENRKNDESRTRMIQKALTAKGEFARERRKSFRMKNLEEYQDLCDAIDIRKLTVSEYVRRNIRPEIREASNGQLAFLFFTTSIPENSLVLLDEPENSLSPGKVLELADYLQASVRLGTQLILSTHSPLLLAMEGAAIYDFDSDPVCRRAWYELESVRIYQRFFQEKSNLFDSGGDGSRK